MILNKYQVAEKSFDAFLSYRRSNGSEFARLIERWFEEKNLSVYIDVERLEAGRFDTALMEAIKKSKNFLLILTPRALDRCIGDEENKDYLHREILAAIEYKCQIIPIIHPDFKWPEEEKLPKDMRAIYEYEGITWDHNYEIAAIDKLERFVKEAPGVNLQCRL